jgi:hypothetical protein
MSKQVCDVLVMKQGVSGRLGARFTGRLSDCLGETPTLHSPAVTHLSTSAQRRSWTLKARYHGARLGIRKKFE